MGGIPEERDRSSCSPDAASTDDVDLSAALEATTRTEASLSALMRAVAQVTSGVSGAQEANERLAAELGRVRELLGSTNEQRLAFKNRIDSLEEALRRSERARHADRERADQERAFLVEEQDSFLRAVLEEHEEQVAALRRELAELRMLPGTHGDKRTLPGVPAPAQEKRTLPGVPAPAQAKRTLQGVPLPANHADLTDTGPNDPAIDKLRSEIDKLLTERDHSRELLRRIQTQRDEAQRELVVAARERDEAKTEIARLNALLEAPPDLTAVLRGEDERRLHPTPSAVRAGRRTDPQQAAQPRPPSTADLPLVEPDPAAAPAPLSQGSADRPPPAALLRRHDPTLRTAGAYAVSPLAPEGKQPEYPPKLLKPDRS